MDEKEAARRAAELDERERRLALREKAVAAGGIKRNLYAHVTCSVRTLDLVILVCALLIVALTVLGILKR